MLHATFPLDVLAQTAPAAVAQPAVGQPFNTEQLDALVASIALYPDDLLTQLLMASTFPLEVVAASRWVEDPAHKSLSGDALVKGLEAEPWDPSVKSLVPFPVVLATMNNNLTWLQQLGYAVATQQQDVFAAVQRLRRLAQMNDKLQSSPEQVVSTQKVTVEAPAGSSQPPTQKEVIVIQPAQSDTVYVPSYDPGVVYGSSWPYPSYPPYYAAPPTGYYFGAALATGLAFAAGAAVVGGLWGWANPSWGGGYANVNVNQFNSINANRSQIASSRWGEPAGGRAANFARAPGGPVGPPGRSQVSVPGNAVRPPTRPGGGWCGRSGRPGRPGGVGGSAVLVGQAVPEVCVVSAVLADWVVPEAWAASAVRVGRVSGSGAVRGASAASAVRVGLAVSAVRVGRAVGGGAAPRRCRGRQQADPAVGWRGPALHRCAASGRRVW